MTELRPLGSNVLIRPTPADTVSEGGIIFADVHTADSAVTGTVIAVGTGRASAHKVRMSTIAHCLKILEEAIDASVFVSSAGAAETADEAIRAYRDRLENLSEVQVDDFVTFPSTAGTLMRVDGEDVLVVDESALTAYWRPEPVAEEPAA